MRIGLISDTHGIVRKQAVAALKGADRLIHAGDIDTPGVLEALEKIAPVSAVLGNMDSPRDFPGLARTDMIDINGVFFYVLHDLYLMDIDPKAAGISVVVSGHTHQPRVEEHDGVLYINPGSAGPKRSGRPLTLALLEIDGPNLRPRIIELEDLAG